MTNLSGHPTTKAPAGWYPHPSMPGTQRYWDGAHWTDHIAPLAVPTPARQSDNGAVVGATILAVILPIVGFIWGIVLVTKDEPKGWLPIAVSVCAFGFFFLVLSAQAQTGY